MGRFAAQACAIKRFTRSIVRLEGEEPTSDLARQLFAVKPRGNPLSRFNT